MTDNHASFPKRQSKLIDTILQERYNQPLEEDEGFTISKGVIEWVNSKQLLDIYNLIHEAVEVQHLSRPAVPLTDAQVNGKIGEKETLFETILENAIKEMWGEDEDNEEESHEELYSMRGGWTYGMIAANIGLSALLTVSL